MLRLGPIVPIDGATYEVSFEGADGAAERVVCRVFEHKGVASVRMQPDLVMSSAPARIDSREAVQAILELHRQRSTGTGGPST